MTSTQRKLEQEVLTDGNRRFRLLVSEIRDYAIFMLDAEGRITSWNRGAERIKGYQANEIIGQHFSRFYTPEDLGDQKPDRALKTAAETGRFEDEGWRMHKNGSRFWANVVITALHDENGHLVGFGKVTRDLTERKRAEDAIRLSESELRDFIEQATVGLHWVGSDGIILWANQAELDMLGYSREEYVGHHISEFHLDSSGAEDLLTRLRRGEILRNYETRLSCKDGSVRYVLTDSGALFQSGKFVHIRCFTRDITDRKVAEEALRQNARELAESREKLATIIAAADVGTWDWDIAAGTVEVSDRFCTMLGYEPGGFGSDVRRFFNSLHPNDVEKVNQSVEAHFTGKTDLYQCDFRLRMEDGSYKWIHDAGRLIEQDREGKPLRMVGVHMDITEQKRGEEELKRFNEELERRVGERTAALGHSLEEREKLEEQLRQAQKLETIGTLAGGIAHDFNNILNIIGGYASLMGRRAGANQYITEAAGIIEESVKRGAAVVQQLLTFARNETASMELTDPNAVIGQVAVLLKETLPKTIELEVQLSPGLPPVMANANQLVQALLNLCLNARDAMPDSGSLIIKTAIADESSLREYGEPQPQPYVSIEVEDTGVGMDERIKRRIFDPFFTTKGVGAGSGLGLAVVYGIVRAHSGFIKVESQPGKGSRFRMLFPPGTPKHAPVQVLHSRARTLFVVEDEKDTLRLLQMDLGQLGYEILTASDGLAAVERYRRYRDRIDMVLLDLGIPKLHGTQILRTIKSERPEVPVIVMTGYLDPEGQLELAQYGVRAIIHKPFSIEEVRNALTLALPEVMR